MWEEITYPFPNFNGTTVEVCEWMGNYVRLFTGHVITYACWDSGLFILVYGTFGVDWGVYLLWRQNLIKGLRSMLFVMYVYKWSTELACWALFQYKDRFFPVYKSLYTFKTIITLSDFHNENCYTGEISLYWHRTLILCKDAKTFLIHTNRW